MIRRVWIRRVEFAWHVGVLLMLLGAFIPMWRQTAGVDTDPLTGDPVVRALLLIALGVSISLLLFYPKTSLYLALKTPWPWLMVGWLFLTAVWSAAPGISVRRAGAIGIATLYGMVLVLRFDFDELIDLLGTVLAISLLSSLIAVIVDPNWALMTAPHLGNWRGVFSHKNSLGIVAAFSVLVFGIMLSHARTLKTRVISIGLLLISMLVVAGSHSATALVLVAVLIAAAVSLAVIRRWRRIWLVIVILGGVLAGVVGIVSLVNYQQVLQLLGRNATLTGRVPLWQIVISVASQRPWLGYGFGAFWLGWNGPSAQVWALSTWQAPHAHNGFLDLWLELGLIGLGLVMGLFLYLFLKAWHMLLNREYGGRFWMLFLLFVLVVNLPEVTILKTGAGKIIYWVLLVYFCFSTIAMGRNSSAGPENQVISIPDE